MQVDRRRDASKVLTWYRQQYGYRTPYWVLCDAKYIALMADNGWKVETTLLRALGINRSSGLRISCCKPVRDELVFMGHERALEYIQGMYNVETASIGYNSGNMSVATVLLTLANENPERRYILATQSPSLRREAHNRHIPVIRYDDKKKAVILDPLLFLKKTSRCKKKVRERVEAKLSVADQSFIQKLRAEMGVQQEKDDKEGDGPKKAKRVWLPATPKPKAMQPTPANPERPRRARRAGRRHRKPSDPAAD